MVALVGLAAAAAALLTAVSATLVLPLGVPWIGAHFRLDPLAAFFLAVVNLGAAAGSVYGIGYGRHEPSPMRVLSICTRSFPRGSQAVHADQSTAIITSEALTTA